MYLRGKEGRVAYQGQGIVLHHAPAYADIIICLDRYYGKIEIIPSKRRSAPLIRGGNVHYLLHERHDGRYTMMASELMALPAAWVDVFLLHQVLELIVNYANFLGESDAVWQTLTLLYQPYQSTLPLIFFKKIFMCRLVIFLGLYEEDTDPHILSLISYAEDSMFDQEDRQIEERITKWLDRSLVLLKSQRRMNTFSLIP